MYLIMEHTANFLHLQGEEALKALRENQGDNTNFLFLVAGHPMHPFFQLLLKRLRGEEMKPEEKETEEDEGRVVALMSLVSDEYGDEDEETKGEERPQEED